MRRVLTTTSAALVLLAAGPAAAQTAPPRLITNPSWNSIPGLDDMGEACPNFAVAAGLDGDATLQCVARPVRNLYCAQFDCPVLAAPPAETIPR